MAETFAITAHRNGEVLHLKLRGDFDGISAHELLSVLKRYSGRTSRVFLYTSCLTSIHPFGQEVFQRNLDALKGTSLELIFTGEHAPRLAPDLPRVFDLTISKTAPAPRSETPSISLSSRKE